MAALALLLSGCGDAGFSGLYNTPLPGGADLGDDPYRLTVEFDDVLDLVPQASVKVNDVAVGRVDKITLSRDTKSALVQVVVNGDVQLPANATAELRQSSLLGEKFVDLRPPTDQPAAGKLGDGARIPKARTNRYPELEEVFGALSLLLSGGGVEQLRTISKELNNALGGNEAEVRALLNRVDTLAGALDGQKGEITRAIDGLHKLSGTLVREEKNLKRGLDDLAPGIKIVAEQKDEIAGTLEALRELSDVTVDTIGKSRRQLVANLRALEPALRKLADAGPDLVEALKILPTYPLPWNAGIDTMRGDFANVDVEFDLNLDQLMANMANSGQSPLDGKIPAPPGGQPPELPETPPFPSLPKLPTDGVQDLLDNLLGGELIGIGGGP
jgi:phospholipid/cholesterol/gamma-HCH transport system substrate-binding protein